MFGRFLTLVAGLAVVSIGIGGVASRSPVAGSRDGEASADSDDSWAKRGGGGWSSDGGSGRVGGGEVTLERDRDSHFYAEARVDGTHIRMLIDSGASIVALTRRDAEAIGIDVDALPIGGSAATAGGVVPMRPLTLDSIEIAGVEVRGVRAAVIDADMPYSLLGQSYLAQLAAVNVEGDRMTLR